MLEYEIEVYGDWVQIVIASKPQRKDLQKYAWPDGQHKGRWVYRIENSNYGWSLHGPVTTSANWVDDLPCVVAGQNRTPVYRRVARCLEALEKLWLELDDNAIPAVFV